MGAPSTTFVNIGIFTNTTTNTSYIYINNSDPTYTYVNKLRINLESEINNPSNITLQNNFSGYTQKYIRTEQGGPSIIIYPPRNNQVMINDSTLSILYISGTLPQILKSGTIINMSKIPRDTNIESCKYGFRYYRDRGQLYLTKSDDSVEYKLEMTFSSSANGALTATETRDNFYNGIRNVGSKHISSADLSLTPINNTNASNNILTVNKVNQYLPSNSSTILFSHPAAERSTTTTAPTIFGIGTRTADIISVGESKIKFGTVGSSAKTLPPSFDSTNFNFTLEENFQNNWYNHAMRETYNTPEGKSYVEHIRDLYALNDRSLSTSLARWLYLCDMPSGTPLAAPDLTTYVSDRNNIDWNATITMQEKAYPDTNPEKR